ncbi:hypothetical protein AAGS40_23420 [Paraburkholderia sp. PREW-6R]|uniref:hypothetical protein n=1 Tax=Paraburkholderia sp. PREW-6R TaxID=3141544 RepID=UPI0031F5B6C1
MAENGDHARRVAADHKADICADTPLKFSIGAFIASEDELIAHDWDGMCLPYGGDGHTRLREIIAAIAALPDRDTKTIDMFSEQAS